MTGEYMPIDAYRLLRQVVVKGRNRFDPSNLDEVTAADFLVSRGFATKEADDVLTPTKAGQDFGRIMKRAP